MSAETKPLIDAWFDMGKEQGATHLIVIWDTLDQDDYPVYAASREEAEKLIAQYSEPTSAVEVLEVYNLAMDRDAQINEHRANNL